MRPVLVLIHGTLLDSRTTFESLWNIQPDAIRDIFARYAARVFAFDHVTLSESPIRAAAALLEAFPPRARLHLLTHGSGGLVADILASVASHKELTERELAVFAASSPADTDALKSVVRVSRKQRVQIERVIRVAGPMRGNALVTRRLDAFLSLFVAALERSDTTTKPDLK